MKALPIKVYYNKLYRECANGGITERYDELLLVCDDGFIDIDENNPPENLVILVERILFGKLSNYIRPYEECPKDKVGYMFGGSYAASSDHRFTEMSGIYGAVPVHDRTETQREYDRLSE